LHRVSRAADALAAPAVRSFPTGTVTFLFTDIERSTELWEHQPYAMVQAIALHDAIMDEVMARHGGYVFSRAGDGLVVAFQRASDAVAAATEAQHRLRHAYWHDDVVLRVRMGAHSGEAFEREGNYLGAPVNRAARVMAAAAAGEVMVTAVTAQLTTARVTVELHDRGLHELRGVSESLQLFSVSLDECE
jgi:class 3 adenylate cyclase